MLRYWKIMYLPMRSARKSGKIPSEEPISTRLLLIGAGFPKRRMGRLKPPLISTEHARTASYYAYQLGSAVGAEGNIGD